MEYKTTYDGILVLTPHANAELPPFLTTHGKHTSAISNWNKEHAASRHRSVAAKLDLSWLNSASGSTLWRAHWVEVVGGSGGVCDIPLEGGDAGARG